MPKLYKTEMSRRQYELVTRMIRLLINRLRLDDPTITYKELAAQLGTNYHKLGQPLLKMAEVIAQCPVKDVPKLNALVVYSSSHLPSLEGLKNACPDTHIDKGNLRQAMNDMNNRAKAFKAWDAVLKSIEENGNSTTKN